jgi:hypothetical protein
MDRARSPNYDTGYGLGVSGAQTGFGAAETAWNMDNSGQNQWGGQKPGFETQGYQVSFLWPI